MPRKVLGEENRKKIINHLLSISSQADFLRRKSIQNAEYDIFGDGLKELRKLLDKINEVIEKDRKQSVPWKLPP